MNQLLVYGLLRRGLSMSDMMAGAVCRGQQQISGFDLFDLGDYPGAVPGAGVLVAELYALASTDSLDALDEAEGVHHNPPLYRRELVALEDGESAWLYIYAQPLEDAPKIDSGDWLSR